MAVSWETRLPVGYTVELGKKGADDEIWQRPPVAMRGGSFGGAGDTRTLGSLGLSRFKFK